MLAVNLAIAGVAGLFVFFPGPIVHTLKSGAANGLSDRALLERALGADGDAVLVHHDARTSEIAKGRRRPDGSIANFTELCDAIDRATAEASGDRLDSQVLPTDRAAFFAMKSSHLLVADREALARQIAAELFGPTRMSSSTAEGFRMQAMSACLQTDAAVRQVLLADREFVLRSKRLLGGGSSRLFAIPDSEALMLTGVSYKWRILARLRSVVLRTTDGASLPVPFHETSDSLDWLPEIEIEPPDGAPAGTLVFTVEIEAYPAFIRTAKDRGEAITKGTTEFEAAYDPAKSTEPSGD